MKIQELVIKQSVIIQIVWGKRVIEFTTEVVDRMENGINVRPYLYQGEPLTLNVEISDGVNCNLFATDVVTNKRMSWRNISLKTVESAQGIVYQVRTSGFNNIGSQDDRRKNERVIIQKQGQAYAKRAEGFIEVTVYDISDIGVSFLAPKSVVLPANQLTILFHDEMDDREFELHVECSVARSQQMGDEVLYGCRIVEENRDFLIYGCLKRLRDKMQNRGESFGEAKAEE